MKKRTGGLRRRAAALLLAGLLVCGAAMPVGAADAAIQQPQTSASQEESAQKYIEQSPVNFSDFMASPLNALGTLFQKNVAGPVRQTLRSFARVLLFLLLCTAVILLMPGEEWRSLLEMLAAGGSFLLISDELVDLASAVAVQSQGWRDFLTAFVPVFASVTAAGGQISSATVYSGFFLLAVSILSEGLRCFLLPAAKGYLAISAAGTFAGSEALSSGCEAAGKLLRRIVAGAGLVFSAILGLQRVFAAATDSAALKAGKALLSGTVPLVGQALSAAADTVSAGMHALQAGLGFAAVAILAADFLPIYLQVLANWLFAAVCALGAKLLGMDRCAGLFRCLSAGLEALSAVLALFFGMVTVSTILMIGIGSGG
ncbi:MAG: stage III sporulation protein AE [Faecalibacterium sp.]|jgi:stage III sporulation protein AE|nr:stage III sporulation protein AE [Faecalibacterium sp.]